MPAGNEENVHLVLGTKVTRKLFQEAAAELGLSKHHAWEPKAKDEAYEEVWTTPDQTRAINYVEDPISRMSYVHFRGAGVDDLIGELMKKLSTFWPEELLEQAYDEEAAHNERVDNLYRLAITFPAFDEEVFGIFEATATRAPHPKLRLAALDALAYRTWPESRAVVERVSREDKDEEVKRAAQKMLPLWDKPPQR